MNQIYRELEVLSYQDVLKIIEDGDIDEIASLPFSIGMKYPNWKTAQNVCVELTKHESSRVRANAILGISYIARVHGKLEKHVVKPIVLKELRDNDEFRWRIIDSIGDINMFMKWNLAEKALKKY